MTDGILLSRVSPRGEGGTKFVFSPEGGGEFSLILPDDFYLDWYSRAGDIIPDNEYLSLEREAENYTAFNTALRLLNYGETTAASLVRKLVQRGIDRDAAIRAADRLTEKGLIDEERYCRRAVKFYLEKKHIGKSRILAELYRKGFRREKVNSALEEISDDDIISACRVQIEKKFGGSIPKDPAERSRAVASLARLGFSPSEINRAEKENN